MRIVQFKTETGETRVARVEGDVLREISGVSSTYELALQSIQSGTAMPDLVTQRLGASTHNYEQVYTSRRLLAPITHPDPGR
ncbi:MAG: hypothetical protein KTR29_18055, partial [Rhodothermaceae bacterium]|nr:hypothetical protein [Rhodothermaceae bacterium]